jgi:SAM-dependent methyltransferase
MPGSVRKSAVRRVALAILLRGFSLVGRTSAATRLSGGRKAVAWSAGGRGTIRRWGTRFDLCLDDNVQRTFYYTAWYERPFLEFLRGELRPDDIYLDVGAHIGIDAAFVARRVPQGRVIAFEASPSTAAAFSGWARERSNVEVVELALGDQCRSIELRANPQWHEHDWATHSQFGSGKILCRAQMPGLASFVRDSDGEDGEPKSADQT